MNEAQLELFRPFEYAPAQMAPVVEAPAPIPEVQLTFFEPASQLRAAWRTALAKLDLAEARRLLLEGPRDEAAEKDLALVELLLGRHAKLERALSDPYEALAGLVPELPAWMVAGAHRTLFALATRLGRDLGAASAGRHLDLAGDSAEAVAVIRSELQARPNDKRLLEHLGDALFRAGDVTEARRAYLAAALQGASLTSAADPDVAGLEETARVVFEITTDLPGWAVAVGLVEGVFSAGLFFEPEVDSAGFAFAHTISKERTAQTHAQRVASRRALKSLHPGLFARYLERL
ncbi:MAG: hypothetical protein HYV07_00695 [Deltaproteobacteria bacterium]|nr:hypothetical protein [Deltaproteobacteria bacterium]